MDPPIKGVIPVDNETNASATRVSADGKQITYRLHVLQQPLRARACGSGAKCTFSRTVTLATMMLADAHTASADRRPVDPPPIVELKIYEGEGTDNDITYNINANYFLFATLVQARAMAHGRVAEDKSRLTVLTGTPVAGMVYLDRPSPAGYFIFPDLSVRHEGQYRLSFSLYEELKDSKDIEKPVDGSRSSTPEAHVTHRLEVMSQAFTVFSAKKFPGLTESTSLSRMVAEQGCRVRIRRDVRMRRRDTKDGGKDWDGYEDETAQARARMSATPDTGSGYPTLPTPHGYAESLSRPRSASIHSISLPNPLSRRTSQQDMAQGYHQTFGTSPQTPQGTYAQSPYGPSPSQQYSQPPFMHQQPAMQPPPPQYHSSHHGYHNYPSAPPPASVPQPQYAHTALDSAPPGHRLSVDYSGQATDARRSSQWSAPPPPVSGYVPQGTAPSCHSYAPSANGYQPSGPPPQHATYPSQHGQHQSYGSLDMYNRPPPPQPVQPPARASGATTPLTGRTFDSRHAPSLSPLQMTADMASRLEPSSPVTAAPPGSSYYSSVSTPIDSHKRSYSSVYSEKHLSQPLKQGARPSISSEYASHSSYSNGTLGLSAPDDGDELTGEGDSQRKALKYHRADGQEMTRHVPVYDERTSYAQERPLI